MIILEHSEPLAIPPDILNNWQRITTIMAKILQVPAGLIMHTVDDNIEVFVSSETQGNPYTVGAKEHLPDSGLYCERVIKTGDKLIVPDALKDPEWDHNPDIKLNMISYMGFPIMEPDGHVFGTICVLDNKANAYDPVGEELLLQFKNLIEAQLGMLHHEMALERANRQLVEQLEEIETLRGIIPICAICKNIRNDKGLWEAAEAYITNHSQVEFSHGICPNCMKSHYAIYNKK